MEKTMTRTFRSVLVAIGLVAAASATAAEKYELSLSTYLPPSYEYIYKPLESFAKRAEEKSQGRLKINIFHSGQLFDGYEELAALSRGDIDVTHLSGDRKIVVQGNRVSERVDLGGRRIIKKKRNK